MEMTSFEKEVIAHMATQTANQKNLLVWTEKLDKKVEKLSTEGCVLGTQHENRIKVLEDAPKRAATSSTVQASGVAALLIGIVKGFEIIFSNR